MQIVAIVHRSAGNEVVGDMWHETKIFHGHTPIVDVLEWASKGQKLIPSNIPDIFLTLADEKEREDG